MIENDQIGAGGCLALGDFGDFASSGEQRSIRPLAATADLGDDLRARGGGERRNFAHAIAIITSPKGKRDDQRTVAAFRTLEHQPAAASCRVHCRGD